MKNLVRYAFSTKTTGGDNGSGESVIIEKEQETKQNKICGQGSQSTDDTYAQRIFGCRELTPDMYLSGPNKPI